MRALLLALLLLASALAPLGAQAAPQNDAGTGGDAGDTVATATRVAPTGLYSGVIAAGDADDVYAFAVPLGGSINVEIRAGLQTGTLVAGDNFDRLAFRLLGPGGALLDTPVTNQGDSRVTLLAAPVAGDYYLHVEGEQHRGAYAFCFLALDVPCPEHGIREIAFTSGPLSRPDAHVLVVPPRHGDAGNPLGPTVLDYLDAALAGIRDWERAIDAFAADYPQYAYLRAISIEVEVFDGVTPVDPALFDFIVVFVDTGGPFFRGAQGGTVDVQDNLDALGLDARFSGRFVVLSVLSASPRAGQLVPDYPEWNDLEAVTKHEFMHAFGLGHTKTWTPAEGADLMNSPAPFVYGDGSTVGDGGLRTPRKCVSSLDLYGLAVLYRHLADGAPAPDAGAFSDVASPLPYTLYC